MFYRSAREVLWMEKESTRVISDSYWGYLRDRNAVTDHRRRRTWFCQNNKYPLTYKTLHNLRNVDQSVLFEIFCPLPTFTFISSGAARRSDKTRGRQPPLWMNGLITLTVIVWTWKVLGAVDLTVIYGPLRRLLCFKGSSFTFELLTSSGSEIKFIVM